MPMTGTGDRQMTRNQYGCRQTRCGSERLQGGVPAPPRPGAGSIRFVTSAMRARGSRSCAARRSGAGRIGLVGRGQQPVGSPGALGHTTMPTPARRARIAFPSGSAGGPGGSWSVSRLPFGRFHRHEARAAPSNDPPARTSLNPAGGPLRATRLGIRRADLQRLTQGLTQDDRPARAVDLQHGLRRIGADGDRRPHGWRRSGVTVAAPNAAHRDAASGSRPPHQWRTMARPRRLRAPRRRAGGQPPRLRLRRCGPRRSQLRRPPPDAPP